MKRRTFGEGSKEVSGDSAAVAQSLDTRLVKIEKCISGLHEAWKQLSERQDKSERDGRAQNNEKQDGIKELKARLARLQQSSEAAAQSSSPQSTCDHFKDFGVRIASLSRRIEEYDKAAHRRYDFLKEKFDDKETSRNDGVTGSNGDLASLTTQMKTLKDEVSTLKQDKRIQHIAEQLTKLEATSRTPSTNRQAISSTGLGNTITDLRNRIGAIESSSLTAALDSRFHSLSEQITEMNTKWREHTVPLERLDTLSDKILALESTRPETNGEGTDGPSLAAKQEDLRRRLDNVEEHARTSAVHHNANASNRTDFQTRLRTLENTVKSRASDAAKEKLAEWMTKIEGQTSEDTLQQRIDSVSARHIATLTDISGRLSTVENESRLTGADVRGDLQATHSRVKALEDSSIAAATDRRFESLSETLQRIREHIAAEDSKDLLSRTARLEEEVRGINAARGVRGQVIADLIQRSETMSSRFDEKQAMVDELALEIQSVSVRHGDLKEQFMDIKDVVDETRAWIERVSEKSRRDDQAVLGKVQLSDREHNPRLSFAEDEMKRLRDGMQFIQISRYFSAAAT